MTLRRPILLRLLLLLVVVLVRIPLLLLVLRASLRSVLLPASAEAVRAVLLLRRIELLPLGTTTVTIAAKLVAAAMLSSI